MWTPGERRFAGRLAVCALLLVAALWTPLAAAQEDKSNISASDRAAAQVLFDQARALLKEGKNQKACLKFNESMRLDPAIGTQLNLAACYEKIGRYASAWVNFVEARAAALKAGQDSRAKIAEDRASKLEPKLSRLTIKVGEPVLGLVVKRDGDIVGRAQLGVPVPVDPGRHTIVAEAPGKKPWRKVIQTSEEPSTQTVVTGKLADLPKPKPPPKPGMSGDTMRAIGYAVGGIGVVGVGLGATFGGLAMAAHDDSLAECLPENENRCTTAGIELRNDALTNAHASTAMFAVGGAALVTGIVLLAVAPDDDAKEDTPPKAAWSVAPVPLEGGAAIVAGGSF